MVDEIGSPMVVDVVLVDVVAVDVAGESVVDAVAFVAVVGVAAVDELIDVTVDWAEVAIVEVVAGAAVDGAGAGDVEGSAAVVVAPPGSGVGEPEVVELDVEDALEVVDDDDGLDGDCWSASSVEPSPSSGRPSAPSDPMSGTRVVGAAIPPSSAVRRRSSPGDGSTSGSMAGNGATRLGL